MISLLLSLMIGYVDPFYARMAEEVCMSNPYGEGFAGTEDTAVRATVRYETFVDDILLLPDERIVVVDVEVTPSVDGLCRLYCLSWNCIYSAKVLCWATRTNQLAGCSYLRLLHEGEDRTRCVNE